MYDFKARVVLCTPAAYSWGRERGAETGNRGGEIDEREAEGAQKQRRWNGEADTESHLHEVSEFCIHRRPEYNETCLIWQIDTGRSYALPAPNYVLVVLPSLLRENNAFHGVTSRITVVVNEISWNILANIHRQIIIRTRVSIWNFLSLCKNYIIFISAFFQTNKRDKMLIYKSDIRNIITNIIKLWPKIKKRREDRVKWQVSTLRSSRFFSLRSMNIYFKCKGYKKVRPLKGTSASRLQTPASRGSVKRKTYFRLRKLSWWRNRREK